MFDPEAGRWTTTDPARLAAVDSSNPQTWNSYAYVTNNPLSFIDPLGLGCDPNDQNCVDVVAPPPDDTDFAINPRGPTQIVPPTGPGGWGCQHFGILCGRRPQPPATNCTPGTPGCFNVPLAACGKGFGFGLTAAGSAEVGGGDTLAAGATGSVGGGLFFG